MGRHVSRFFHNPCRKARRRGGPVASRLRPDFRSRPHPSCRPMISSSSAPARPARSWRKNCRPPAASRFWCWRPAAPTGASTCRCRSATARPSSTRRSTGTTRPSRIRAWRQCRPLAARQIARRLELDQRHGLDQGRARGFRCLARLPATPAGAMTISCPPSRRWRTIEAGADQWRGVGGPLHVTDCSDAVHPLTKRYLAAAQQAGLPLNPDFNGAAQEGVGVYQIIDQERPPHVGGARLPATGYEAQERPRRDERAGNQDPVRGQARRRRRVSAERRDASLPAPAAR